MKFTQFYKHQDYVSISVNGDGNLRLQATGELDEEDQVVEITKEVFIQLCLYKTEIIKEMDKNRKFFMIEESENDA
jgi:hypothetical protein